MRRAAALFLTFPLLAGSLAGAQAEYVGGTITALPPRSIGIILTGDSRSLVFQTRQTVLRIPYARVNQLEYGQKVDRRYLEAILISPLFVLAKRRAHFLTVGYQTEESQQEALVFRVEKGDIRAVLVSLEAKTGLRVTYQDEEARKAGKG
jgi:hypothetical protein